MESLNLGSFSLIQLFMQPSVQLRAIAEPV